MKYYCIIAKIDTFSCQIKQDIQDALNQYYIYDEQKPDLVITVGGDGTILRAVQTYVARLDKVHFVGIHTGTLGFYTDYEHFEVDQLIKDILENKYELNKMPMIQVDYMKDNKHQQFFALNEARVENAIATLVCDIFINDEFLETFRGNGICLSSSSGSTAYNRSLGGSVIAPGVQVMQLTEIAGIHHNAYRSLQSSLILDQKQSVNITLKSKEKVLLGVDQSIYDLHDVSQVKFSLSERYVSFIHYRPMSFIRRIRKAFING